MKTPQERARDLFPDDGTLRIWIDEELLARVAGAIREAQREALDDACRLAMGEPPMGEGEYGEVRNAYLAFKDPTMIGGRPWTATDRRRLFDYVDHLRARLLLLSQEEEGQAYARGFDEGHAQGHRIGWQDAAGACCVWLQGHGEAFLADGVSEALAEEPPR